MTAQAMDVFGVVARSVRQAISDLEWGGYLKRRQVGRQARASDAVVLTEKGDGRSLTTRLRLTS